MTVAIGAMFFRSCFEGLGAAADKTINRDNLREQTEIMAQKQREEAKGEHAA